MGMLRVLPPDLAGILVEALALGYRRMRHIHSSRGVPLLNQLGNHSPYGGVQAEIACKNRPSSSRGIVSNQPV